MISAAPVLLSLLAVVAGATGAPTGFLEEAFLPYTTIDLGSGAEAGFPRRRGRARGRRRSAWGRSGCESSRRDGGATWSVIADALPVTNERHGYHWWQVPGPATRRGRIRASWTEDPSIRGVSARFAIGP